MESTQPVSDWETLFAPYDQGTYQTVLDHLRPDDVILDIGAGDLRLDRRMARIVQKVYAVEINPRALDQAMTLSEPLPANLIPICADARTFDFPSGITAGVLLMRHCTCFPLYAGKLQKAGATQLITNARWHMDVEIVNLLVQRKPFTDAGMGWYACSCGGTGFKEGPAEHWSPEMDQVINELSNCPQCM
jgi:16S rRNA A1518/A1519 N6-dimethyltransferase RsmA/KsgA/DIM1 with predicted DNA glycosylase/AP lyase activity